MRVILSLTFLVFSTFAQANSFLPLGDLPGGANAGRAHGISPDGSTVVGFSTTENGWVAFKWTIVDGMVALGGNESAAWATSSDATVIIGTIDAGGEAFRWTSSEGIVPLGALRPTSYGSGYDVSANGAVIVGSSATEGFRWTAAEGMIGLGGLGSAGGLGSPAQAISADGNVIVGRVGNEAYRWTSTSGMVSLGDFSGGILRSSAFGANSDGSVVIGYGNNSQGREAFRWTAATGLQGLGEIAGGAYSSIAFDVSDDGNIIVGASATASGNEAAIWTAATGFQRLQDILASTGVVTSGWVFSQCDAVSANGKWVACTGTNPEGHGEPFLANIGSLSNDAPKADAGSDQSIRAGETVGLDGSASFDDNTASNDLMYAWSIFSQPIGSSASLVGEDTATPSFVADIAGTYIVDLVVTDEGGLSSDTDSVSISSDNLAPNADAGTDQLVLVGSFVDLSGSLSTDPETDPLNFFWTFTSKPAGSTTALDDPASELPRFIADLAGTYTVSLAVSDFIGSSLPDTVQITSVSPANYAIVLIVDTHDEIELLGDGEVTNKGNQNALGNFLEQAVIALQAGDIAEAINKLNKAIIRTDGCALRGSVDGNGSERDWITTCAAQQAIYTLLIEALDAINP